MAESNGSASQRLAWIEGIRIFAAVMILLYHAQLLITDYAFTPQPTGLLDNLQRLAQASDRLGQGFITSLTSLPIWFGFQYVDVFILISGFSLVLSLRGRALELIQFYKRRFARVLIPFWTVAWLSYPILIAIGIATSSYVPSAWNIFAGLTFPILFDYGGELLVPTSGPWWFVSLILSFILIFPLLWHLLQRWGGRNLLVVSLLITLAYRALAIYQFKGHPTYVVLDTPSEESPFLSFLSKLSIFVLGMVIAHAYRYGKGPVFWHYRRALIWGTLLYALGFVTQFYVWGWVVCDLMTSAGLGLCCMVLFKAIAHLQPLQSVLIWLGLHSYSYFLIHNFVVDRTITLVVEKNLSLYYLFLPVMIIGTLVLAAIADYTTPSLKRLVMSLMRDVDYLLTPSPPTKQRVWRPAMGDRVTYKGKNTWKVVQIQTMLDEHEFYLCQISDGQKTMWISEDELEPAIATPPNSIHKNGHSKTGSIIS
ncbi:acyltransferase [Oscillatoria sp. FACHB-1407]|uniref:acyltransferase family protein n=1 Tax=Oscillatoria sp. FACHB-1407 TaxID=2692847 RepID=UPI001687C95E|nr:acyltransferase [Oscillatoria sp. FACHB-1407]MBD2460911.1 acyltransferase [Oscillatoria sp. FACHB-1407]